MCLLITFIQSVVQEPRVGEVLRAKRWNDKQWDQAKIRPGKRALQVALHTEDRPLMPALPLP